MAKQQQHEPLTGAALRQKVKTLATLSKTQKAKACGYYTVSKGGGERINLLQFLQALLEAEGVALDRPAAERGRVGRQASYRIAVQANGNLLIGAAYTEQMVLHPGDAFELVLGRKHIQLKQLDPVNWLWKYSIPQLRESLRARSFEQTLLREAIGQDRDAPLVQRPRRSGRCQNAGPLPTDLTSAASVSSTSAMT